MTTLSRLRHRWAALLLVASALLLMGAVNGNPRFDRLGHNLMCECGCGQVLLECNHVGCTTSEQMRSELKAAIESGESDDAVLAGFVSKYGPAVLSAPTKSGFNLVAWIMPFAIFVLAVGVVIVVVRAWKRRAAPAQLLQMPQPDADLDEYRRRARKETEL
jgi:cytochrome c-type biogenesis protein CcmH